MKFPIADVFNELKSSCGSDGRFYAVKVLLKSGSHESGWPLDATSCYPEVLHLQKDHTVCLIPIENIDKIYLTDTRREPKGVSHHGQ